MRILVLSNDPKQTEGFSIVTRHILNACSNITNEVVLLSIGTTENRNITKKGKYIISGVMKFKTDKTYNENLQRAIELVNPDLVLVHNDMNVMYELYYGSPYYRFCLRDLKSLKIGWIGPIDTYILHRIDYDMCSKLHISMPYTNYGKDLLNATSVFRLGNSLDIDKYTDAPLDHFLCVAANRWKKKLNVLCDIFLTYLRINPNAKLTIKTSDDLLSKKYSHKNLNIISSNISNKDLIDLYLTHGTYISLCPNEGWGIPLSDATFANMRIITVDFKVHDEATGEIYGRIPTYDSYIFDGYRYIAIPNYGMTINIIEDYKIRNNNKISYWKESEQNLINEIKRIMG